MIRVVAYLAAATGVFVILRSWSSYSHFFPTLRDTWSLAGPLTALEIGVLLLIPIIKLIVVLGLMRLKRWAWTVLFTALTLDIALTAIAGAKMYAYQRSGTGPPPSNGGAIVETVSMWPAYIIAVINLASLIILLQPSVRARFNSASKRHPAI